MFSLFIPTTMHLYSISAENTSNLAPPYRTPPRGGGWGPDLRGLRDFGRILNGIRSKVAIWRRRRQKRV